LNSSGPFRAFEGMCQIIRDPIMLVATETRAPYTRSRILSVNTACEELLQFNLARLFNQSLHQLLVDPEDPLNTSWQTYNFDLEQPWQGSIQLRTRANKTIAADVTVSRIGYEQGENYYVLRLGVKPAKETPVVQSPSLGANPSSNNFVAAPILPTESAPKQEPEIPDWVKQLSAPQTIPSPANNPFSTQTPFSPSFALDSLGTLPSWSSAETSSAAPLPDAVTATVEEIASTPIEAPAVTPEIAANKTPELVPAAIENLDTGTKIVLPTATLPSENHLASVLDLTPASIFRVGIAQDHCYFIDANRQHELITGFESAKIRGKRVDLVLPTAQAQIAENHYRHCAESGRPMVYEIYLLTPLGERWFQTTLTPIADASGKIQELVGVSLDVTDRRHTADALAQKIEQQAAIAELGQLALTQLDLDLMLNKATEIVAQGLSVPFCKVQEYISNEQKLLLRAGYGWDSGFVGVHTSSIWENTQAASTLKSLNPIIVENFDTEKRVESSDLLKSHGIKSGAAVVISGLSGPFGILSVHSHNARAFSQDQIFFLQAAADTLANAIKNNLSEQALRESERLVSSILESAQIGIGVSDESGRFIRVNPNFCKIFGYEAKDLLGREFTILLPFAEHQQARQIYTQFMKTGIEAAGEGTCLRSDGRPVDVQITAGRLQRADGSMLRVTTVEDITQRKITENSLKLFQLAAINSHDGIIITEPAPVDNPGPKIIFANAASSAITGFAANEILGATLRIFQGPESDPEKAREIQSAMRARVPAEVEMVLHRRDKTTYWAQVTVAPVTDMQGRHMNWLITFRDITERKQNENLLEIAKDQAVSASQAKSDFLAGISHEIRTPLNAIIGFSDVLRREIFGPLGHERYRTYSQDIHDSGRHLLQLINNTLDLSKIEAGVLELHESEVPIEAIVRSSVALLRDNAVNAQLTMETELAADLPLLFGDETKIKQILLNMLSNAIKYTLPGGKIIVRSMLVEGGLALQVEDSGVGIPQHDLPKVMQKYMQASNEQNKHQTGTGLGIPVIKSLIELHQGSLDLASVEGQGTTITVVFPSARLRQAQSRPFPAAKKSGGAKKAS
jgi:PAS domain S-box-containing protein